MTRRTVLSSLGTTFALRQCDVVGDDVRIDGSPSIHNRGRLEIGRGTMISSRPVATHFATGQDGSLLIGGGVAIGYGCSIVAQGLVTVGSGTKIGPFVMVCDVDDDVSTGWRRTARPIVIGSNVSIGTKVTVLPGTFIPDGSVVPAGSVVSGTIGRVSDIPARQGVAATVDATAGGTVAARVAEILREVLSRSTSAPMSVEFERMSGWCAATALRLLDAVEKEFQTRIPDDEWLEIETPGDLVRAIERRAGWGREGSIELSAV